MDPGAPGAAGTPAPPSRAPSQTEVLATTIAALVERQLAAQAAKVDSQLEEMRQQARVDSESLRSLLEAKMGSHAATAQARADEFEARLDQVAHMSGADYVDEQVGALAARIEDGQKVLRRFDEQAGALVQHVNETTSALSKRMDDGDQTIAHAVEQRLLQVREAFEELGTDVQRQVGEQAAMFNSKLEGSDARITDRMLALEERVKEDFGTKVANLDATIGRVGSGFDDAMGALSQRMLELENRLHEANDRMDAMAEQIGKVDENAIAEIKDQLSTTIGEAMLVRIEMDRYSATADERFDKTNIRLAEVEAQINDQMDVSAVVQLERLDELERAVAHLDPTQFVRKTDLAGGAYATPPASPSSSAFDAPSSDPTLPAGSPTSEPSLSSF